MISVFGHLPVVTRYLDNFMIYSNSFDEHVKHKVLKILAEKGQILNFEKSTFFSKVIKLRGHVFSKNQIKMDPDKIKSLDNRKPPQNLKQLQQYLGLTNYFHKFVEGYAKIAHLLFDLLILNGSGQQKQMKLLNY